LRAAKDESVSSAFAPSFFAPAKARAQKRCALLQMTALSFRLGLASSKGPLAGWRARLSAHLLAASAKRIMHSRSR